MQDLCNDKVTFVYLHARITAAIEVVKIHSRSDAMYRAVWMRVL